MGAYVDWTKLPYQYPGSGLHHLVLRGEQSHNISVETFSQRRSEYMRLTRRKAKTLDVKKSTA